MALSSVEQAQFGLKKEASRGTAETTATKWYPISKDSTMDYSLALLKDESLRGAPEEFPPNAGVKTGTGKIKMPLDAQSCGEMFYSCLGGVSSAVQGATAAYKHTFTRGTGIQRPGYTFFMDRGLNIMKYNLSTVKKLTLNFPTDQIATLDADVLFKSEATGLIGTPAFPVNKYVGFNQVDVKVAGSSNTDVKDLTINIDNNAQAHRTLSLSQDVSDILVKGKLIIDGNFTIFFQDVTERDKFLANTSSVLRALCVGGQAAVGYYYTVDINLYKIHYKAFPYGEAEGLLAAKAEFVSVYDSTATKAILVDVTNLETAY
jgi:hypothetical protein